MRCLFAAVREFHVAPPKFRLPRKVPSASDPDLKDLNPKSSTLVLRACEASRGTPAASVTGEWQLQFTIEAGARAVLCLRSGLDDASACGQFHDVQKHQPPTIVILEQPKIAEAAIKVGSLLSMSCKSWGQAEYLLGLPCSVKSEAHGKLPQPMGQEAAKE